MNLTWELIGTVLAIVVPAASIFGFVWQSGARRRRRARLEAYLKREMEKGVDQGARTVLHLERNLGMTESQILAAVEKSKRIRLVTTVNPATGLSSERLFKYA